MNHNIELQERSTETKDKQIPKIVIYEIDDIKTHFDKNIELVNNQFPISEQLLTTNNKEAAETIWRSQIVLIASAFDFFMHEIVWYGLNKIYREDWNYTTKYKNLSISMEKFICYKEAPDDRKWFYEYITDKYKTQTIMFYDDVKNHLNLIGVELIKIANNAFHQQGCTIKPKDQLKKKLNSLYSHRNRIVHQSDQDAGNAERYDITKEQVNEYINDIKKIAFAIIDEVKNKE